MSDLPRIGITLQHTDYGIHPVELAKEVESRGFDSLFVPEHSHIPASRRTRWPGSRPGHDDPLPDHYSHLNDQLVTLSMAGAVTERIELGTAITLLAQHDPIWFAKQIATLDHLTNGRVVLGLGFGWNREEMESHGVDFKSRRKLSEEKLGLIRALWTQEEASYQGDLVKLEPSWSYPKPAQQGGPTIVLGGGTGPVLFDSICRYADGWMPISARSSITDRIAPLKEKWVQAGRDPDNLQIIVAGATTDPDGLQNLGRQGVQRALLTIWEERRDGILATLDKFTKILQQTRGV